MRKLSIIVLFLASLFMIFSCEPFNNGAEGSINIVNVSAKDLLAPVYGEIDPAVKTAAVGANDFAFRLGADLVKNYDGKNFVFSPYSVWLPLAALVNAADTQHRAVLLSALGASGITEDSINKAASRMLYDLTNARDAGEKDYYNPLRIVNAIFVDKTVTLRRDFAQTFMDFYRGSAINADFSSRDAVNAVNRWASENTNGLITDLIQQFDPMTFAAIANAIYFSDRWSWEFDPQKTEEGVFHAPTEDTRAFYMIREGSNQTYYEDNRVQAITLGFKHSAGMYIILPKTGGAETLLSSMSNAFLNEIQQNSYQAEGKLLLPRFSIENDTMDLQESLKTLGVPLFKEDSLIGLIDEYPLFLSAAVQKAVIKVDEKGTTAAAVTVMAATATSLPPPNKPFVMICDRPFVFILYNYTYEGGPQILFTGIVNQP